MREAESTEADEGDSFCCERGQRTLALRATRLLRRDS
jgi:hypothetical protein